MEIPADHLGRRPRGRAARPLDEPPARQVPATAARASCATRRKFDFQGGVFSFERGAPDGEWCDFWLYDDLVYPFPKLSAAIGFENLDNAPVTFDEIRPGCWKQKERLEDMDANHVDASLCFPNVLPRFCGPDVPRAPGQGARAAVRPGLQRLDDRRVVRRRRHGQARSRSRSSRCGTPSSPPPRSAAAPTRAATRSRSPRTRTRSACRRCTTPTRFWDPFFQACEETDTVVNMHIGSSSKMPSTSPDAPFIVSSMLTFQNAMGSMVDYIFSGVFQTVPRRCASRTARARSAGRRTCSSGPTSCGRSAATTVVRLDLPAAAVELRHGPHLVLHLRRRDRPAEPRRRSAWTRSPSRSTTRTPTRRSRTRSRRRPRSSQKAGLDRRRDLQVPPRQRHQPVPPRQVLRHQEVARDRAHVPELPMVPCLRGKEPSAVASIGSALERVGRVSRRRRRRTTGRAAARTRRRRPRPRGSGRPAAPRRARR